MPELQSSEVTYKFTLGEIKNMLAKELNVRVEAVTVTYNKVDVSEGYDRYPSYKVGSVSVTVDKTKIK